MYLILNIILVFFIINTITMILINKKKDKIKEEVENFINEKQTNIFRLMSYNVKMFSNYLFDDAQLERAKIIPSKINKIDPNLDCIILTELFNNKSEKIIDKEMKKYGYKYRSEKVGTSVFGLFKFKLEDGGVKIYSKHPIIEQDDIVYSKGGKEDKISAKGSTYIKVNKYGKKFNIFATHLQSGRTDELNEIKLHQVSELKEFINKQKIKEEEPIFIGGDFNIDLHSQKILLEKVIEELEAEQLEIHIDSLTHTTNTDFSSRETSKISTKWLDHIFYLKDNKSPIKSNIKSIHIKKENGYLIKKIEGEKMFKFKKYGDYMKIYDLSDHTAIIGEFIF